MSTTTPEQLATLGRRAVAAGFRWMPRMLEIEGATCCKVLDGEPWLWFVDDCVTEHDGEPCIPDLSDPATLGCLLALVREAWGNCIDIEECYTAKGACVFLVRCHVGEDCREFEAGDLGSALVAALGAGR